jgi:hypothetical protein
LPYGGRYAQAFTWATAFSFAFIRSISRAWLAAESRFMFGWSQVWSPIAYPASTSFRTSEGRAATFTPMLKKVAGTR